MSAVKKLVPNEQDWDVKKAMAQVIISMANESYLHLEGGEALVEFIILNSSIPDEEITQWNLAQAKKGDGKKGGAQPTSPGEIRGMCDHVLTLMTTTMPPMINVLWPFLLEPLTKTEFNHSMAVVAKSIAHIAEVKRASNDSNYVIDFTRSVNVPRPEEIVARMFILVNLPNRRGDQGLNLLKSMLHCGPILHPALPPLWDSTIPKLIKYLETAANGAGEGSDKAMDTKWTGLIRRLLTETLKTVGDDRWMMAVGDAMMAQLSLHGNDAECRKVTYKLMGVILQISTHKDFLKSTLSQLFKETTHTNELERMGCAQGYGYASLTHLDSVLEELSQHISAAPPPAAKKESSGGGFFSSLFGGGGDKPKKAEGGGGGGSALHTVLLSYGFISINTKPALVRSFFLPLPFAFFLPIALSLLCTHRHRHHLQTIHTSLTLSAPFTPRHSDDFELEASSHYH